jgi:hypothetical protein
MSQRASLTIRAVNGKIVTVESGKRYEMGPSKCVHGGGLIQITVGLVLPVRGSATVGGDTLVGLPCGHECRLLLLPNSPLPAS